MDINYTRTEHFLAISRHLTIRLYGIYIQHPGFHLPQQSGLKY